MSKLDTPPQIEPRKNTLPIITIVIFVLALSFIFLNHMFSEEGSTSSTASENEQSTTVEQNNSENINDITYLTVTDMAELINEWTKLKMINGIRVDEYLFSFDYLRLTHNLQGGTNIKADGVGGSAEFMNGRLEKTLPIALQNNGINVTIADDHETEEWDTLGWEYRTTILGPNDTEIKIYTMQPAEHSLGNAMIIFPASQWGYIMQINTYEENSWTNYEDSYAVRIAKEFLKIYDPNFLPEGVYRSDYTGITSDSNNSQNIPESTVLKPESNEDGTTVWRGNADADGNASADIQLPADTTPGWHTLSISGIDTEGNPLRIEKRILVGENGEILEIKE